MNGFLVVSNMMKRYSLGLVLAAIFLLVTEVAQAQIGNYRGRINSFGRNKRYLSVGFGINSLNYFGDLAPKNNIGSTKLSFTRPGFNVAANYRMGPQMTVRGSFMWGRLFGNDFSADINDENGRSRYIRNQHFRNDIKELSVGLVFDLKKNPRTFISRPDLVPYITAGIAVFHHNPKAMVPEFDYVHYSSGSAIRGNDERYGGISPGDWIDLKPLKTEGTSYSNFAFALPFGAGIRYKLDRYFDLSFEVTYHQTFTDYIDDVSGYYQDLYKFGEGPEANLARLMSYRGHERQNVAAGSERESLEGITTVSKYYEKNGFPFYGPDPSPGQGNLRSNYQPYAGYGEESPGAIRGKPDNDVYLVANITVSYIIGTSVRNAKFR